MAAETVKMVPETMRRLPRDSARLEVKIVAAKFALLATMRIDVNADMGLIRSLVGGDLQVFVLMRVKPVAVIICREPTQKFKCLFHIYTTSQFLICIMSFYL